MDIYISFSIRQSDSFQVLQVISYACNGTVGQILSYPVIQTSVLCNIGSFVFSDENFAQFLRQPLSVHFEQIIELSRFLLFINVFNSFSFYV